MKKITQILLLSALALTLVATGTGCTAKAKKIYHEKRADKFFAAGDFDGAEIEYLNVLKNDNENAHAFARLGGIYYEDGRLQHAAFFLGRASELATNDLDVRLKLGFVYSTGGKIQEARDNANFVLDRNPQDPEAPLLLAESAVRPKEIEAARQRLLTLIKTRDSAALQVGLGNLYFKEHDLVKAAAAFQRAQGLDAKSAAVNVALGALSWAREDVKQADVFFKQAAEVSPLRSPRRMQYVRFKIQTGGLAEARTTLDEVLKKSPEYLPALLSLAEIEARENKFEACNTLLGKVLARDENNFGAMLFLGQLKQAQGNFGEAVAAFERMARVYSLSPQVHYYLALAAFAGDDGNKALAALARALELQPDYADATLLQAQVFLRSGNASPVIVGLEKLRQKQPGLTAAQLLLADAYRMQARLPEALAIYQALEKSSPTNTQMPLLQGAALMQLKRADDARQAFNRVLKLEPDNLPALEQLVELDLADKNFSAASQRIQAELVKRPKQIELHLIQAKVLILQGDTQAAEAELLRTAELDPKNPNPYLLLAQLYFDTKQNQKSLTKLEEAIACAPKNVPALMMLATIHSTEKDYAKAASAYERVLVIDPKFSPAMNNLAYLCSENLNQLDRAYDLAQEVRKLLPIDPYTADTLGWICFKRGDYATAFGLLSESVAKVTDETEIQAHYGLAAYMLADEATARTALTAAVQAGKALTIQEECQRALTFLNVDPRTANAATRTALEQRVSAKPDDLVAQERLAMILERDGETEKALRAYEKVLAVNPKNFNTTLHLAGLYAAKDTKKAYELAKVAYQLSPYDPAVLQLLGRLAYGSGDFKLAASLFQETLKKRTDDAALYLELAKAAFAIGKIQDAQAALNGASKLNMAAPRAAEVKRMAQLIQAFDTAAPTTADQALIAEALRAEPNYLPALAAQAATAERTGNLSAAVAGYEKILPLYPDFAPAQKQLVQLYAKGTNQVARAYELALKVRDAYPNDPALTKAVGIILIQKADYARAANMLKTIATAAASDPEIFFYLGTAQFQLKNPADCKASLQRALSLKLAAPQAEAARKMLATLK